MQDLHGHRGRAPDPLYRARRTLHTGADLLTDKQRGRLDALFAVDEHVEVEATWAIYQAMIAAYCEPGRIKGRRLMTRLIDSISRDVPAALSEVVTLGRTPAKRAGDILAYFDRPGTSNGPTEAICEYRGGWSGTGWQGGRWSFSLAVTRTPFGPSGALQSTGPTRVTADASRPISMA